jgi:hypothetical protein
MLTNPHRYGHSAGLVGYVFAFNVFVATILNGDSFSCGVQRLVSPYSHTQSSYVSPLSQFQSSSSDNPHPQDGQGNPTAVTIQLPHISAIGEGRFNHTFCGQTHIAIHSCAVSVGAAYILIIEGYVPHGARKKSSAPDFNHRGIGIGQNGVINVQGKWNIGSHLHIVRVNGSRGIHHIM